MKGLFSSNSIEESNKNKIIKIEIDDINDVINNNIWQEIKEVVNES